MQLRARLTILEFRCASYQRVIVLPESTTTTRLGERCRREKWFEACSQFAHTNARLDLDDMQQWPVTMRPAIDEVLSGECLGKKEE